MLYALLESICQELTSKNLRLQQEIDSLPSVEEYELQQEQTKEAMTSWTKRFDKNQRILDKLQRDEADLHSRVMELETAKEALTAENGRLRSQRDDVSRKYRLSQKELQRAKDKALRPVTKRFRSNEQDP